MRKLSAVLIMMLLLFVLSVCANAADFEVKSTSLGIAQAFEEYSYQIEMVDENTSEYTFTAISGLPAGLTLSPGGLVSGKPTTSGFFSVGINMAKEDGTSDFRYFSIRVIPIAMSVEITASDVLYDGQPHSVTYVCRDEDGNVIDDVKPSIRYGSRLTDAVTNAGNYYLTVYAPSGYVLSSVTGDDHLNILKAKVETLTVDNAEYDYDGNSHPIPEANIHLEPAAAGYRVEYSRNGGEFTTTEPKAGGEYTVRVSTTNSNYESKTALATLKINAVSLTFIINNTSKQYNGNPQGVDITVNDENVKYEVVYTDRNGDTVEGEPKNAGTYSVRVVPENADAYNISGNTATFTISPKPITFTVQDSLSYTQSAQTPSVSTNPEYSGKYSVTYLAQNAEAGTEAAATVTNMGTYDVFIEIEDGNYTVDAASTKTVTVGAQTVNFTVTGYEKTYDGSPQSVTVTPDVEGFTSYEVKYTTSGGSGYVTPENAGSYTIEITSTDTGYTVGTIDHDTLTIKKMPLTFTVTGVDKEIKYDSEKHEATVKAEDTDGKEVAQTGVYTVQYRGSEGVTDPVEIDVYDIIITVTNSNYERAADDTAEYKLTIISSVNAELKIGNSPAALIYADTEHDDEWKAAALEYLEENRQFDKNHLPTGLNESAANIKYPKVNGIDLDANPATVFVKDIKDFTDPGMTVEGSDEILMGGEPKAVSGFDGLYKVTYTYERLTRERYVAVIGTIGDVNNNGVVNTIDANFLDKALKTSTEIKNMAHARVWDVNKDGSLTADDSEAIRNRFSQKLVPYYPWL